LISKRKRRQWAIENNRCTNPFRKKRCEDPNIELYIMYEGEKLPICDKCWRVIAEGSQEW
jgi:hypothetical protein